MRTLFLLMISAFTLFTQASSSAPGDERVQNKEKLRPSRVALTEVQEKALKKAFCEKKYNKVNIQDIQSCVRATVVVDFYINDHVNGGNMQVYKATTIYFTQKSFKDSNRKLSRAQLCRVTLASDDGEKIKLNKDDIDYSKLELQLTSPCNILIDSEGRFAEPGVAS